MPDIRIGISGWTYAPWRETFFPRGLPQKRELAYAANHVRTIEINGTFYSMQRPSIYRGWYEQTPEDFIFAVKGPRFITHLKRLKDVVAPVANFFASGILRLNEKLGPILWQLPPSMQYDPEQLTEFFNLLPRTTREAGLVGRRHDHRLKARAWLRTDVSRPVRHALEVRHPSFENADFIALLRRHGIALVVADTARKWPLIREVTGDCAYVRLHGDEELYASGYSDDVLRDWARRIRSWSMGGDALDATNLGSPIERRPRGRDVYVYFDNDVKTHAPFDAMRLNHMLALGPPAPSRPMDSDLKAEVVRRGWSGCGPKRRLSRVADRNMAHRTNRGISKTVKTKGNS